ncbi:putative transmembrane protein [Gregarina niphandrodes]|uniref:Transmembrane protein n=1 Tax=Gregarina niphandrodes TaxID=110365 RepID=A0A023B3P7_GRENI|nr:putative transmembrane protein [Gregarina niphandrodes]EZG55887.1 putative transmembrane protein [Gregarina niphandrodes]|eukprot:XP_011131429.1 putative transmembrane protein [Gregarina niphandrodes]
MRSLRSIQFGGVKGGSVLAVVVGRPIDGRVSDDGKEGGLLEVSSASESERWDEGEKLRMVIVEDLSLPEDLSNGCLTSSDDNDQAKKLPMLIIEDARSHTDTEGEQLARPTARFWRRPWFGAGVGGAAGTALVTYLILLLRAGDRPGDDVVPAPSSVSEVTTYHSTPATHSSSLSPDFVPDLSEIGKISETELALLKAPTDVCRRTYSDVVQAKNDLPMVEATSIAWQKLDWNDCASYGGRIVCTRDQNTDDGNLGCHYFGTPWKFDLPTVWEGVVRHVKPTECSYQCNDKDEHDKLLTVRRALEIAGSIPGVDLDGVSEQDLYTLGREVGLFLNYYARRPGSPFQDLSPPKLTPWFDPCSESAETLYESWARTPSEDVERMQFEKVTGFWTDKYLPPYYSAAVRTEGYDVKHHNIYCYLLTEEDKQTVLDAWNKIAPAYRRPAS